MNKHRIVIFLTGIILFSATVCGTAFGQLWVGDHWPTMAYNPVNQTYVMLYQPYGQFHPSGKAIDPWGSPRWDIDTFALYPSWSEEYSKPSMAYDSANERFLAVWTGPWPFNNLYGQFLNGYGHPIGDTPFAVSNGPGAQTDVRVTFDPLNGRFLVTWVDYRTDNHAALYGQLLNAGGTLQGTEFVIDADLGGKGASYSIAYDHVNGKYLAVWEWGAVSGRLINADGTPEGDKFSIVEYSECNFGSASVAFDSVNARYLVAYEGGNCGAGFINGQLVNADGTLHQGFIGIGSIGHNPSVAYDEVNQRFLAAWTIGNTYGQFVNADGTLQGEQITVSRKSKVNIGDEPGTPAIAFNPQCGNFLVAGTSVKTFPSRQVWALQSLIETKVVGDPCPQVALTVKKQGADRQKWRLFGTGLKCVGNLCKGKYIAGSTARVTADIDINAWTGCDALADDVCSVTMDGKKTVTATYTRPKKIAPDTVSGF